MTTELQPCYHCGMHHPGVCPRIKRIDYYPDGSIKSVEYHEERPAPAVVSPLPSDGDMILDGCRSIWNPGEIEDMAEQIKKAMDKSRGTNNG